MTFNFLSVNNSTVWSCFPETFTMASLLGLVASAWLLPTAYGASHSLAPSTSATSAHAQYTLPSSIDVGAQLIANIDDPLAVDAQSVCPGYKASNVHQTSQGFTASLQLAGGPCNVYGTDVDSLSLTVDYLAKDRLNIQIVPTYVDASNASWYLLSEHLVPRAQGSGVSASQSDFEVKWSNEPSFNLKVIRKATGDVLFDTEGSVLVFENQFIEFVSSLPESYNLYGLGERMAQLRLLRNATLTTYAADVGDPIDRYVADHGWNLMNEVDKLTISSPATSMDSIRSIWTLDTIPKARMGPTRLSTPTRRTCPRIMNHSPTVSF
jgi:alpha-glucosidase